MQCSPEASQGCYNILTRKTEAALKHCLVSTYNIMQLGKHQNSTEERGVNFDRYVTIDSLVACPLIFYKPLLAV